MAFYTVVFIQQENLKKYNNNIIWLRDLGKANDADTKDQTRIFTLEVDLIARWASLEAQFFRQAYLICHLGVSALIG